MGVKLRITRVQLLDQSRDIPLIHARVLQQAKDSRSMPDAKPAQGGAGARREQRKDQRVTGAIEQMSRRQPQVQSEGITREPQMRDAPVTGVAHQYSEDCRVQVKMEMSVDVVEREAGRAEFFKLRRHFTFELPAQVRAKKIAEPGRNRVVSEVAPGINQAGNFARGQRRCSA